MQNEPSLYEFKNCNCGYSEVKELPSLYLNHSIIEEQGFKKLQNAILINLDHLDAFECKRKIERTINVNAHVFIEANVRTAQNINESVSCRVTDFPNCINLLGENLRLVLNYFYFYCLYALSILLN